jgi:hypothetical protein
MRNCKFCGEQIMFRMIQGSPWPFNLDGSRHHCSATLPSVAVAAAPRARFLDEKPWQQPPPSRGNHPKRKTFDWFSGRGLLFLQGCALAIFLAIIWLIVTVAEYIVSWISSVISWFSG